MRWFIPLALMIFIPSFFLVGCVPQPARHDIARAAPTAFSSTETPVSGKMTSPFPGPGITSTPIHVPGGSQILFTQDLLDSLAAQGYSVVSEGDVDQPIFPVVGMNYQTDDFPFQVYEFPEPQAAQAASRMVSPDGAQIGDQTISWAGQPNFWCKGNLIVLYIGKEEAALDIFTSLLGEPITLPSGTEVGEYPPAVIIAMNYLAEMLGVSPEEIEVISFLHVDWADSCLGIISDKMMCAEVITPGWNIVLQVDGERYELHTNEDAALIRRK